jgi:hypothetical protein
MEESIKESPGFSLPGLKLCLSRCSPLTRCSPRPLAQYRRDFKPELYPQKHDQEDQDRVQHDPHNVGSPTPSLLYSLPSKIARKTRCPDRLNTLR